MITRKFKADGSAEGLLGADAKVRESLAEADKNDNLLEKVLNFHLSS